MTTLARSGTTGPDAPGFAEAFATFAKIGFLSFGGPAGQIALMHRILVDEKRWLDEPTFLHALNFCMLLPGPEAMQLATYAGWKMHGVKGGLAAGLLFVLPGAAIVLALTAVYVAFGKVPLVEAAFVGIKAAVLVIVVEALIRVSRRALKDAADWTIAGGAFIALFLFGAPFPLVIVAAGALGYWRGGRRGEQSEPDFTQRPVPAGQKRRTLATAAVWMAIWWTPLIAILLIAGSDHVLWKLALFFSKLAVVTFGGAYAVLSYMAQQAVETYGWLRPVEMVDGLGLAETTPGPLILVTEFVGFVAGFRSGAQSMAMGVAGAAVALWATFVPCFLWIFAGAPYVDRLRNNPRLRSALASVTAAVVGVILNLSIWFALHVLFARVEAREVGPLRLLVPEPSSLDGLTLALGIIAAATLFLMRIGILWTLALCAALAIGAQFVN